MALRRARGRADHPAAAPAELRRLDAVERFVDRLASSLAGVRQDVDAVSAAEAATAAATLELANALTEQQRVQIAEMERRSQRHVAQLAEARATWELHIAAAETSHVQAVQAASLEHASRLADVASGRAESARRLLETGRDLEAKLVDTAHGLRAELEVPLQQLGARLDDADQARQELTRVLGDTDARLDRLGEHAVTIDGRLEQQAVAIVACVRAAEEASAAVGDALAAGAARVDVLAAGQRDLHHADGALHDTIAIITAEAGRIDARADAHQQLIEGVTLRLAQIDVVTAELGDLRNQITAAVLVVEQSEHTDVEEQLDRMEAFERLAAENDPESFVSRSELDVLRARLDVFRDILQHTAPLAVGSAMAGSTPVGG